VLFTAAIVTYAQANFMMMASWFVLSAARRSWRFVFEGLIVLIAVAFVTFVLTMRLRCELV